MRSPAREFWTPDVVRAEIEGEWLARGTAALGGGASIDTRSLRPGEIFFALRGERSDGHRYLAHAANAGAAVAVIDDPRTAGELPPGLPVLAVPDARVALGRLGAAYRRALRSTTVIAVTGSNGKTTTTRMIDACLRTGLRGRCSAKSFNNDLGLPLTILGADPDHDYLVCEVGMNAPGEMEPLAAMARPDIAVVTSIGSAHLAALGSVEAVAAEKITLARHLAPSGTAVLTADAPALGPWIDRFERVATFGVSPGADLRVGDVRESVDGVSFTINGEPFTLPGLGAHNAVNAGAAVAVARRIGIADGAIRAALASFTPAEMRLNRVRIAGIDIINDAYNANPDSMQAAVRTLRAIAPPGSRRVALLGDMLEMGEAGPAAHRDLARLIAEERGADIVILVGPLAALAAPGLAGAGIGHVLLASLDGEGADRAASLLREGDTVLLKGSRGMRLERVLDALRAASPANA